MWLQDQSKTNIVIGSDEVVETLLRNLVRKLEVCALLDIPGASTSWLSRLYLCWRTCAETVDFSLLIILRNISTKKGCVLWRISLRI